MPSERLRPAPTANRLGGNALAEIFTMGSRVGEAVGRQTINIPEPLSMGHRAEDEKQRLQKLFYANGVRPARLIEELKTVMWHKIGILRERDDIEAALDRICGHWPQASIATPGDLIKYLEFENMRLVAEMVGRAALERNESRGSHYRIDFPREDNLNWIKNIIVYKGSSGMAISSAAVPESKTEIW